MSEKEFDELIKVASSDIFDEDFDLDGNTESVEVSHRPGTCRHHSGCAR